MEVNREKRRGIIMKMKTKEDYMGKKWKFLGHENSVWYHTVPKGFFTVGKIYMPVDVHVYNDKEFPDDGQFFSDLGVLMWEELNCFEEVE